MCVSVCICICMLVCACISAWKLDEDSGIPAAGYIDICKMDDMGDGN